MNGGVIVDDFNLSEKVLVIRLKDIAQVNILDFINNSDRKFKLDVKISFQQGKEKEEWDVSILPGGNTSLRLNRKE